MGFLGCNVMKKGGSKIYQPFSVSGGVGPLCGFSTYFNGSENVDVDFVYRAPMHMESDSASNLTKTLDWFATGFDITLNANIIFTEQNVNSRYFRHESSISSIAIVSISYLSTSAELRFFARCSNGINYGFSVDMTGLDFNECQFTWNSTTKVIEACVDGVVENSSTFTPTGTMTMDEHFIANEDIGTNYSTMLLTSYEATGLGKADFVTNQTDGLNIISDNGTVWLITEDVAGSSQIKADGTSSTAYVWPDTSKLYLPAVGYSQFDLTNTLTQAVPKVNIDFSDEWVMIIENLFIASDAVDDCQIVQWNDVLGRTLIFFYDQTNRRFRCTVFDGTSNKTVNVGSLGAPVEYATRYHVIIKSVGGTIATRAYSMEVVGYAGTNIDTDTLDFTPYTVQNTSFFNIGGVGKKYSGTIGNVSWVTPTGAAYFDTFPLENRVPASSDLNVDDIVGLDNSSVMEPSIDRSYKYPYLGASQELISDTPCVGDAFLTSGGAFMLSGGCPLVRGAWNPGYSKTSYTGGIDHIVYCGDSNAQTNAFPGEGITPYPDRHAAYCATWLPDVTITNIALSGLSLYGMSQAAYDRVKPYNTDPSLSLVGRYISDITHNVEHAVSLGATIIVMSSGVATWTNSFTEGPYLAYEDMQIFEATKVYLDGLGIKLIAITPVASKAVSVLLDATGLNTMSAQYNSILPSLGIDVIDENGVMRQGTEYIADSFMKDDTHKNDDGQIYLTEYGIIPGFDRIFNMRR